MYTDYQILKDAYKLLRVSTQHGFIISITLGGIGGVAIVLFVYSYLWVLDLLPWPYLFAVLMILFFYFVMSFSSLFSSVFMSFLVLAHLEGRSLGPLRALFATIRRADVILRSSLLLSILMATLLNISYVLSGKKIKGKLYFNALSMAMGIIADITASEVLTILPAVIAKYNVDTPETLKRAWELFQKYFKKELGVKLRLYAIRNVLAWLLIGFVFIIFLAGLSTGDFGKYRIGPLDIFFIFLVVSIPLYLMFIMVLDTIVSVMSTFIIYYIDSKKFPEWFHWSTKSLITSCIADGGVVEETV